MTELKHDAEVIANVQKLADAEVEKLQTQLDNVKTKNTENKTGFDESKVEVAQTKTTLEISRELEKFLSEVSKVAFSNETDEKAVKYIEKLNERLAAEQKSVTAAKKLVENADKALKKAEEASSKKTDDKGLEAAKVSAQKVKDQLEADLEAKETRYEEAQKDIDTQNKVDVAFIEILKLNNVINEADQAVKDAKLISSKTSKESSDLANNQKAVIDAEKTLAKAKEDKVEYVDQLLSDAKEISSKLAEKLEEQEVKFAELDAKFAKTTKKEALLQTQFDVATKVAEKVGPKARTNVQQAAVSEFLANRKQRIADHYKENEKVKPTEEVEADDAELTTEEAKTAKAVDKEEGKGFFNRFSTTTLVFAGIGAAAAAALTLPTVAAAPFGLAAVKVGTNLLIGTVAGAIFKKIGETAVNVAKATFNKVKSVLGYGVDKVAEEVAKKVDVTVTAPAADVAQTNHVAAELAKREESKAETLSK